MESKHLKTYDPLNALLGIRCHQRGFEPFFPSTAFFSGKLYNYSRSKETISKNSDHENKSFEAHNANETMNKKHKDSVRNRNLYECTDDCIKATDEDCIFFRNILRTFQNATDKNIRKELQEYDQCNNINPTDIYLLPREKRNHPKECYEQGCTGFSVVVRKLSIHYKNCRKLMTLLNNLNTAHQIIHDMDVATVVGDIEYLIKLLALPTTKSPSVFSSSDYPPNQLENYDKYKAAFEKNCKDLPEIVCQSCDMLIPVKDIKYPKDTWLKIQNKTFAWELLKKKAKY